MKLTVSQVKASRIPAALNVCPTDARLLPWVNESIERLLRKALYIGTYGRFRICATDGCITLPPQIASIERVAICGVPVPLHDMWFEFLSNGLGPRNASCSTSGGCGCGTGACGVAEANLRGWFPTFADIRGTAKKLRLIADVSADVGKRVLCLGYDENNNWIRTNPGGVWQDGETVTLAQSPGTDTTKFFDGGVTGIQFLDAREGQVWLYERDTVASTSRMIGSYQYFETNPSYARYLFPSVFAQPSDSGCTTTQVEIVGRLEYFPVAKDTDVLLIGNIPALKNMAVAVKTYEEAVNNADLQRAAAFEAMAMKELDNEIEFYLGEGREVGVNFKGANIGTVRPVANFL